MRPRGDRPSTLPRFVTAMAALLVGLVIGGSSPALAHTDFDYSEPAAGAVAAEPVSVVTVAFTNPAEEAGDGFSALNPQGELQEPVSVEISDDRVFVLTFDPPLAGGVAGVRWMVRAGDAHPIDGAFSFTVEAPVPTTAPPTTAAPTTLTPPTSVDDATNPTDVATTVASESTATTATTDPAASTAGTTAVATSEPAASIAGSTTTSPEAVAAAAGDGDSAAPTLEEFLATDESAPGETTATIGRIVGYPGLVVGIGALAFAATTFRGRRGEVGSLIAVIRGLGVLAVVGAAIEYVGVSRLVDESLTSSWSTEPGSAPALRLLGGVLLALGVSFVVQRVARPLSASVVADSSVPSASDRADRAADPVVRWVPDRHSWAAFVGVAVIAASFWFDGHTVSRGPRIVHAFVDTVHVLAAAVWAGGVVTMAVVVWIRHRSGAPVRAAELVVRFSKSAGLALGAVAVAGLVMAVFVLDSFGDLTGSEWGRLLLLKTAAVAVAAGFGAYNHFRLLPELEAEPDSTELAGRLRTTITAEAVLLTGVVIVTAVLVAASTV